ncbi:TPA: hypothetical protein DD617_04430, partial [Candidatus Uhrbacteria bacterium]|nr:hypothetical protein [Candidatus Uhrbacteria bacterium]
VVPDHWQTYRDELQDVHNGVVLSRLVFSTGYKQLWVYDTNKDPVNMQAIPGTWTPPHEDIVGAHFREDGTIEYFQMYQWYVYDGKQAVAQGDYVSWYRETENAMQIVGSRMAWLDPNDVLRVSDVSGVKTFGAVGVSGEFRLTEGHLFYASADGKGKKYDFNTKETSDTTFVVTHESVDASAGVDSYGNIWYKNAHSGASLKIGFGADPVLADETHVYWRGFDDTIYEATIAVGIHSVMVDARSVKLATDSTVYVVANGTRYTVPNENVYVSWFGTWNTLETISEKELDSFVEGGVLSYAPGTKLKLAHDPKVYVVGTDGSLHWMTTQTIAYMIFGSFWNHEILEITQMDLTGLHLGSSLLTERDAQAI